MNKDLSEKSIHGFFWSFIERIGSLSVQLLITIIIARILNPKDFGLVGMLSVFVAIGNVIIDSGFGQAIIREKDVTKNELSSIFYFNILLSLIVYSILYFLSPEIGSFFNQEILVSISRVMFLVFPVNAISLIHYSILLKKIDLTSLAKISIISAIISGIIGVFLAFNSFNVWALVYQIVSYSVFKSILLWIYIKWRPSFVFRFSYIRKYLSFSFNLLITNIIIVFFNNLYTVVIGRYYPLNQVGYYNQAKQFEDLSTQSLNTIIQRVSYPILSKLTNVDDLKYGYKKIITHTVFLNFPLMFGLLIVAPSLFTILLTDKWHESVIYFQLLCVYGALFPLHSINVNILKVKGLTNILLRLEILRRVIMVIFILLTIKFGIIHLLIGNIISSLISILLNMHFCGREVNYSVKEQVVDILPYFMICILSFIILYPLHYTFYNSYTLFFVQLSCFVIMYFGLSYLLQLKTLFSVLFQIKNIYLKWKTNLK